MSPNSPTQTLAVPPEPTDHMLGSEHARVTLVEYGDFECPSCKVAATTPKLLLERFPNRIRFVFRHFPLQEAHPARLDGGGGVGGGCGAGEILAHARSAVPEPGASQGQGSASLCRGV